MPKMTKDQEMYGELINIDESGQFVKRLIANWNREYSKAFNIYDLKKDDIGKSFNWSCRWIRKNNVRPYKIIGQFEQDLLLVQRTDTKRYYRMPTREVAEAFKANLECNYIYEQDKDI